MRRVLKKFILAGLPMMFVFSVFATNAPAPADTGFADPDITGDNPATKRLADVLKKNGVTTAGMLDEHFLFASVFWSGVAGGYLFYARRQRAVTPFIGGVLMVAASFLVTSWFWMSLICLGLMFGVYYQMKRGD